MKYLLTQESLASKIDTIKNNFIDYINLNKNWYLRNSDLSVALFQGFCHKYGFDYNQMKDGSYYSSKPIETQYNISPKTLNSWFREWREVELSKIKGTSKYKPTPHHLRDGDNYYNV